VVFRCNCGREPERSAEFDAELLRRVRRALDGTRAKSDQNGAFEKQR
jgi:hypothetical protein